MLHKRYRTKLLKKDITTKCLTKKNEHKQCNLSKQIWNQKEKKYPNQNKMRNSPIQYQQLNYAQMKNQQ